MVRLSPWSPGPGHDKAESMSVFRWGPISERSAPVVLVVESTCHGECRISVLFTGVALSEKSPYLGSAWVRLKQRRLARAVGFSRFVVMAGLILGSLCWVGNAESSNCGVTKDEQS